jgi:uncharacterized repeat protein (TIGR03803 family)
MAPTQRRGWCRVLTADFYGTISGGGTNSYGTVFKISATSSLMTLHSFDLNDGADPEGLVLGIDGNFYGITSYGGTTNSGTVFKITPAGKLTTLHNFDETTGSSPRGALVQALDLNFYGTTQSGGPAAIMAQSLKSHLQVN